MFPTPVPPKWVVEEDGISRTVHTGTAPHQDHIETSGEKCSLILTYGTGEGGTLVESPQVVWPMLRTLPNDTHASLRFTFGSKERPTLTLDGRPVSETLKRARLDGVIHLETQSGPLQIHHAWFADRKRPLAIER
ncbi:hypothetical protein BH11ARM2_BH11ARM2_12780 [soil metagenome]